MASMARSVSSFSLVNSVPSTSETTIAIRVMASGPGLADNTGDDVIDDGFDRRVDRYRDRLLVGLRGLQRPELAVEKSRRHEVSLASGKAVGNQRRAPFEKHDAHIGSSAHQDIAIGAFQCRAGHHEMAAGPAYAADFIRDRLQPRPAVFIGQR